MIFFLLQAAQESGGFRIDTGWLVTFAGSVMTALLTTIGALWRQSVAESKRKDQLIDRLLQQTERNVDVQDRAVSLVEKEKGVRR